MKQCLVKAVSTVALVGALGSCSMFEKEKTLPPPTDWVTEASKSFEIGEFQNAVRLYQKAIDLKGASFQSYYALGRCYAQLKQYGKSVKAFEKAIALAKQEGSDDLKTAEVRLMIAYYDAGLYDATISKAEKTLGYDATHLQAYRYLAKSHYELKDYDAALKAYRQYLPKLSSSSTNRIEALEQASMSAYGLRKSQEARQLYETYFKLKQARAKYITNDDWYWRGQMANINLEEELKNLYWSKLPTNFLKSKGIK